jgi:hypothetical protein
LLPFEDSTPRAYRLKGSNAYLTFSTSIGTSPRLPRSGCAEGRNEEKYYVKSISYSSLEV